MHPNHSTIITILSRALLKSPPNEMLSSWYTGHQNQCRTWSSSCSKVENHQNRTTNNITWNRLEYVAKAVVNRISAYSVTCQYPLDNSSMVYHSLPTSISKVSSIWGSGYVSLADIIKLVVVHTEPGAAITLLYQDYWGRPTPIAQFDLSPTSISETQIIFLISAIHWCAHLIGSWYHVLIWAEETSQHNFEAQQSALLFVNYPDHQEYHTPGLTSEPPPKGAKVYPASRRRSNKRVGLKGQLAPHCVPWLKNSIMAYKRLSTSLGSKTLNNTSSLGLGVTKI